MQEFVCKDCGGSMLGDGYTTVYHCENSLPMAYEHLEPDSNSVFCMQDLSNNV